MHITLPQEMETLEEHLKLDTVDLPGFYSRRGSPALTQILTETIGWSEILKKIADSSCRELMHGKL